MTRDFPSEQTTQRNRLGDEDCKTNTVVTGVEFLDVESPHAAKLDDPYWSQQGNSCASIESAAAWGEITQGRARPLEDHRTIFKIGSQQPDNVVQTVESTAALHHLTSSISPGLQVLSNHGSSAP